MALQNSTHRRYRTRRESRANRPIPARSMKHNRECFSLIFALSPFLLHTFECCGSTRCKREGVECVCVPVSFIESNNSKWKRDESDSVFWVDLFFFKVNLSRRGFGSVEWIINKREKMNPKQQQQEKNIKYTWNRYHMWPDRKWPMTDTNQQQVRISYTSSQLCRRCLRLPWPRLLHSSFIHMIVHPKITHHLRHSFSFVPSLHLILGEKEQTCMLARTENRDQLN